jgi:quinol monooxygenase YgiN
MPYGRLGSMKARPGRRDDVVAILVRGLDELRAAGCDSYVVGVAEDDEDTIWVTEVWRSREEHRASLALPSVKAAIAEAMPMLTGDFTSQEMRVAGGLSEPLRDPGA